LDRFLLGIDVGTTGVKAALFTREGLLAAVGRAEYPTQFPRPGWAEQDPQDWWRAVCLAIHQVLAEIPGAAARVAAAAVSAQAPTLLALDGNGIPLRPALIWMDRRAEPQAAALKGLFGSDAIERLAGNRSDPFYVAPKLRWFKENEPELFGRTATFAQINGYIGFRLTNAWSLDPVHAALLLLRDWKTGAWLPDMCAACGVEPALFPAIRPGHDRLGEVTADAAAQTGLAVGTPVMVGTVDGAAAALEAGAVEPGLAAEMTGTSTVLLMPNDSAATQAAFIAMPHAISGLSLLLGAMATSGACLRWYRDQFGQPESQAGRETGTDPYDLLTEAAAGVRPGSRGVLFLPYMMGERSPIWNTNARGVLFGLTLSTPREAVVRAILEGTVYALRHNVEVAMQAGVRLQEIRCVGGGARSHLWCQMKADILGLPILVPKTSVGAAFGAGVLAGMGIGWYPDVKGALRAMVAVEKTFEPRSENQRIYQEMYAAFRSLYEHLRGDFDAVASILQEPSPITPPGAAAP
jgi:xylulokinase